MIKSDRIDKNFKDLDKIEEMMNTLFPECERGPFPNIVKAASMSGCLFNAYYDEGTLIGFSFAIETDPAVYLLYLGVSNKVQSRGYGGKILETIKDCYPAKPIILAIEAIDPAAANIEQRIKRLEFYKRHDFNPTEVEYTIGKDKYVILSHCENRDFNDYDAMIEPVCEILSAIVGKKMKDITANRYCRT